MGDGLSPDVLRYLRMGAGIPQPRPFHYRWLIPWACKDNRRRWNVVEYGSFAVVCALAWAYTGAWAAMFVPIGLAGVGKFNLRRAALVDLPAMAVALASAVCAQHGWWPEAVVLAVIAGCVKESGPVFGAIWAWNPVLLVGLVAPAARMLVPAGPETFGRKHVEALTRPFRTARYTHSGLWRRPEVWILPWGALLVGLGRPDLAVLTAVGAAYGQCFVATDTVRLYQWAWPALALRTFVLIPSPWWPLVVLVHLANPYRGEGA